MSGARGRGRGRRHDGACAGAASVPIPLALTSAGTSPTDSVIDGSQGEGGGQILRTSLSLAVILRRSVRIHRIRAGRPKPGLARQHLVAVTAAAELGGGTLFGATLGSTELMYHPPPAERVLGPTYEFDIGSAGSTSLVLQTLLPILLLASRAATHSIEVQLCGGTHNPMSPPFDFLHLCFLPALNAMGWRVEVHLLRHGFFPGGGGRLRVLVHPVTTLAAYCSLHRGAMVRRTGVVLAAGLSDADTRREEAELRMALGWAGREVEVRPVVATGRGSVMFATVEYEHAVEVATGFLDRPSDAKEVAAALAQQVRAYVVESSAPIGEHLADQLLLPLLLGAGGEFRFSVASEHFRTNVNVIEAFCGPCIEYHEDATATSGPSVVATVRVPACVPACPRVPGAASEAPAARAAAVAAPSHE